jgi:hypothetical protein
MPGPSRNILIAQIHHLVVFRVGADSSRSMWVLTLVIWRGFGFVPILTYFDRRFPGANRSGSSSIFCLVAFQVVCTEDFGPESGSGTVSQAGPVQLLTTGRLKISDSKDPSFGGVSGLFRFWHRSVKRFRFSYRRRDRLKTSGYDSEEPSFGGVSGLFRFSIS